MRKNKKTLGLLLSLTLVTTAVAPSTLAAEADRHNANAAVSEGKAETKENVETAMEDDGLSGEENFANYDKIIVVNATSSNSDSEFADDKDETDQDGSLTDTDLPVQVESPSNADKKPVDPEEFIHVEGCSDECDGINCDCPCHELSLFERFMACETYEEMMNLLKATSEEEAQTLTEDEANQVIAKLLELEPQPLPPVGDGTFEVISIDDEETPLSSEIVYQTVNFDDVAPFGAPVIG